MPKAKLQKGLASLVAALPIRARVGVTGVVIAALLAVVGSVAITAVPVVSASSASQAYASAHRVRNSASSYRDVNIYNHAGCFREHADVAPGHWAPSDHVWTTFWLPAHADAHLYNYANGDGYWLSNSHNWATCHNIGNTYSIEGWRIQLVKVELASQPVAAVTLNRAKLALAA